MKDLGLFILAHIKIVSEPLYKPLLAQASSEAAHQIPWQDLSSLAICKGRGICIGTKEDNSKNLSKLNLLYNFSTLTHLIPHNTLTAFL